MLLKKLDHTEDDNRLYVVDYSNILCPGDWITAVEVAVDVASVTLSTPEIVEPAQITFYADGGVVGSDFVVTVTVTLNTTERFNDTVEFHVVSP